MHLANPAHGAVLVCLVLALLAAFGAAIISALQHAYAVTFLASSIALLAAAFIVTA